MKRELPPTEWRGKQVVTHWNLHDRCVSVKYRGEKVRHAASVLLEGVTFKVNEAGRLRAIAEGSRNVHAYAAGQLMQQSANAWGMEITQPELVAIGYNPFTGCYFYRKDTGTPVHTAEVLVISRSPNGKHGAMIAKL